MREHFDRDTDAAVVCPYPEAGCDGDGATLCESCPKRDDDPRYQRSDCEECRKSTQHIDMGTNPDGRRVCGFCLRMYHARCTEAATVWERLSRNARVAIMEASYGLTGMLCSDVPPALWQYRCGCGSLCDSSVACPMGEEPPSLTDLGRRVAAHGKAVSK